MAYGYVGRGDEGTRDIAEEEKAIWLIGEAGRSEKRKSNRLKIHEARENSNLERQFVKSMHARAPPRNEGLLPPSIPDSCLLESKWRLSITRFSRSAPFFPAAASATCRDSPPKIAPSLPPQTILIVFFRVRSPTPGEGKGIRAIMRLAISPRFFVVRFY